MKLKICRVRDEQTANQLLAAGVDYLGFHVLDEARTERRQQLAELNAILRRSGFDGGVLLTKVPDLDWIVKTAVVGRFKHVQVHRDATVENTAELAERLREKGSSLIQVIDPGVHDARFAMSVLAHAEFVLYDNYVGGTSLRISDALLATMPMDRAFVAGGIDDTRASEIMTRFTPYGIDVQSWVERADKSKDLERVATLVAIADSSN